MALYRGETKVAGIGKGFEPENVGTEGQVLTKTNTGYAYQDPQEVDSELSAISENPVQNKVITNALQNVGGSSDHLEEKALVGEKYALTDTLFKQLTPKLADCTVDANVGDVAANTEIHIQRQGSGTASNKLKLKVKKVGAPSASLYVEVRKGIQVDVSDSEAYWYGDSSNIIATGSLASSSFSSSYAEIEFTLDNNFGGTEGELLDVVVYQSTGSGATVDSSNYYQIACDSTQWSEAFSYVKVNGSTRSREKLMPYCVSDGFAQDMLCKVTASPVYTTNYYPTSQSRSNDVVYFDIPKIVALKNSTCKLSYTSNVEYSGQTQTVSFGDGVNNMASFSFNIGKGSFTLPSEVTINNGGNISKITGTFTAFQDYGTCIFNNNGYYITSITLTCTLGFTASRILSLPRELKAIGNKVSATIFGIHIDGSRFTQD